MAPPKRIILAITSCCLVGVLDGFDAQVAPLSMPILADHFQRPPKDMGAVLAAGLLGVMIGSLAFGALADRFGRRQVILLTTGIFGLFTLLAATCRSPEELALLRFLAGLGLGGALPNVAAKVAEMAPTQGRGACISLVYAGFPAGAALGAVLGAWVIPAFGWAIMFVIGGVLPLALVMLLYRILPRDLPSPAPEHAWPRPANWIRALLSPPMRRSTLALWASCFFAMAVLFFLLSWLPSLLFMGGLGFKGAALATAALNLGGMAGGLTAGLMIDRWGIVRPIAGTFTLLAALMLSFGQMMQPDAILVIVMLCAGFLANAGVIGIGVAATIVYPAHHRSTGVGTMLAIGRVGSVLAPMAGTLLIAQGLPTITIIAWLAAPCLLACLGLVAARFPTDRHHPVPVSSTH